MNRFDPKLEEYDALEGPVYWSKDRTFRIDQVNSPLFPYLKVYKAVEDAFNIYDDNTKMCRLTLDTLEYVDGIGSNWILSKDEMEYIKKVLSSPCYQDINITILEYIKNEWEKNKEWNSRKKKENSGCLFSRITKQIGQKMMK